MSRTYFHDFTRDNGLPITVEYSAGGGEPNFDFPGHICDGGGSDPEIAILKAWPNTPGHDRLAKLDLDLWLHRRKQFGETLTAVLRWPLRALIRIDEWWRASLTDAERERMEAWIAEHYVDDDDDPEDWR